MNQDFLLPSSPGMARKLVRIARMTGSDLDPNIEAMAEHDLLAAGAFDDWLFPRTPERAVMLQFLLDSGMRAGIVPENTASARATVLNAARLAGLSTVVVATRDPKGWREAIASSGLPEGAVTVLSPRLAFSLEEQQDRREGLLVQDLIGWASFTYENIAAFTVMARQFAKTVVLADQDALVGVEQTRLNFERNLPMATDHDGPRHDGSPWWEMGAILFPQMPTFHLMKGPSQLYREVLNRSSWKQGGTNRDDLAHLYNIWLPGGYRTEIEAAARHDAPTS